MTSTVPPWQPPPELRQWSLARLRQVVWRNDPTLRCRSRDADDFFKQQTVVMARRLCRGCPIQAPCAELALREEQSGYITGIRGGLSPRERRVLARLREAERTGVVRPVRSWETKA